MWSFCFTVASSPRSSARQSVGGYQRSHGSLPRPWGCGRDPWTGVRSWAARWGAAQVGVSVSRTGGGSEGCCRRRWLRTSGLLWLSASGGPPQPGPLLGWPAPMTGCPGRCGRLLARCFVATPRVVGGCVPTGPSAGLLVATRPGRRCRVGEPVRPSRTSSVTSCLQGGLVVGSGSAVVRLAGSMDLPACPVVERCSRYPEVGCRTRFLGRRHSRLVLAP